MCIFFGKNGDYSNQYKRILHITTNDFITANLKKIMYCSSSNGNFFMYKFTGIETLNNTFYDYNFTISLDCNNFFISSYFIKIIRIERCDTKYQNYQNILQTYFNHFNNVNRNYFPKMKRDGQKKRQSNTTIYTILIASSI